MQRHPTVNGQQLREDRDTLRWPRRKLLAEVATLGGPVLDKSMLERAEKGKVSPENLAWFAKALGRSVDRYQILGLGQNQTDDEDSCPQPDTYLAQKPYWTTLYDFSGDWTAYYVEDDVNASGYIATETITVVQLGSFLTGLYTPLANNHPSGSYLGDSSFRLEAAVIQNTLVGRYFVEGRAHPKGSGVVHLEVRNEDWLEGFCSFYGDDSHVNMGANIWIRNNASCAALLHEQAIFVMLTNNRLSKTPISSTP